MLADKMVLSGALKKDPVYFVDSKILIVYSKDWAHYIKIQAGLKLDHEII